MVGEVPKKAPLERAAAQGNRGLAQKLVEMQDQDALHKAVWFGHGEVVTDLLENGALINTPETTDYTAKILSTLLPNKEEPR